MGLTPRSKRGYKGVRGSPRRSRELGAAGVCSAQARLPPVLARVDPRRPTIRRGQPHEAPERRKAQRLESAVTSRTSVARGNGLRPRRGGPGLGPAPRWARAEYGVASAGHNATAGTSIPPSEDAGQAGDGTLMAGAAAPAGRDDSSSFDDDPLLTSASGPQRSCCSAAGGEKRVTLRLTAPRPGPASRSGA